MSTDIGTGVVRWSEYLSTSTLSVSEGSDSFGGYPDVPEANSHRSHRSLFGCAADWIAVLEEDGGCSSFWLSAPFFLSEFTGILFAPAQINYPGAPRPLGSIRRGDVIFGRSAFCFRETPPTSVSEHI